MNTPRSARLAWFTLLAIFGLLTLPVVFLSSGEVLGISESADQEIYHLPVIHTMIQQWPHVDLVNYRSTTSPGYHLFFAFLNRSLGASTTTMQLVNVALSALLLIVVAWIAVRIFRSSSTTQRKSGFVPWVALILVAPILASSYFLGAAIWLTTDNVALLPVLAAVGGAATLRAAPARTFRWSVFAALAVAMRQIHLWVIGPLGVAAFAASPAAWLLPRGLRSRMDEPRAWLNLILGSLFLCIPIALMAWFYAQWGGLTPPAYRHLHDAGAQPATIGFALTLFGGFGLFFLPAFRSVFHPTLLKPASVLCAFVIGLVIGALWPSFYSVELGRYGGIWNIVKLAPVIADRSLFLALGSGCGAVVILLMWQHLLRMGRGRETLIIFLALAGFTLAQSLNTRCYQRYFEVLFLAGLAWLAALAASPSKDAPELAPEPRRAWLAGPMALAAIQLLISLFQLYRHVLASGQPIESLP